MVVGQLKKVESKKEDMVLLFANIKGKYGCGTAGTQCGEADLITISKPSTHTYI